MEAKCRKKRQQQKQKPDYTKTTLACRKILPHTCTLQVLPSSSPTTERFFMILEIKDRTHLGRKLAGRELVILVVVFWVGLSAQLAQGLQDGLHQLLLGQLLWLELCQPVHNLCAANSLSLLFAADSPSTLRAAHLLSLPCAADSLSLLCAADTLLVLCAADSLPILCAAIVLSLLCAAHSATAAPSHNALSMQINHVSYKSPWPQYVTSSHCGLLVVSRHAVRDLAHKACRL